jgi:hypothetical protein
MYPEKMQSSKSQYAGPLTDLHGRQCESLPKKGWIIILNANVNLSMCLQHLGDGPHHVCQIYMNCLAVTPFMDGSTLVMCNRGIYILYIHVYIYIHMLYILYTSCIIISLAHTRSWEATLPTPCAHILIGRHTSYVTSLSPTGGWMQTTRCCSVLLRTIGHIPFDE